MAEIMSWLTRHGLESSRPYSHNTRSISIRSGCSPKTMSTNSGSALWPRACRLLAALDNLRQLMRYHRRVMKLNAAPTDGDVRRPGRLHGTGNPAGSEVMRDILRGYQYLVAVHDRVGGHVAKLMGHGRLDFWVATCA